MTKKLQKSIQYYSPVQHVASNTHSSYVAMWSSICSVYNNFTPVKTRLQIKTMQQ